MSKKHKKRFKHQKNAASSAIAAIQSPSTAITDGGTAEVVTPMPGPTASTPSHSYFRELRFIGLIFIGLLIMLSVVTLTSHQSGYLDVLGARLQSLLHIVP